MTATALLSDLRALGITLQPKGDRLRFHPREAVTPELLDQIKQHKPELLRLLTGLQPLGTPQPQDDDADGWREFTTPDWQGIERPNAPSRQPDLLRPDPLPRLRRLVGELYPPKPHELIDPRIIAGPVVVCPTCNAARVLVELRTMTGGLCWECHLRKQPTQSLGDNDHDQQPKRRTTCGGSIERLVDG